MSALFCCTPGDEPKLLMIDHINNDTLDNRRCNLRLVTNSQNGENRRGPARGSCSKVLGVHWNKQRGMWQTRITIEGKRIFLGHYSDIDSAADAIHKVKRKKS
ncbi:HNH endonuclease [Paenibacillus tianmuensis]|uniref:HNH endonuclease n=1 Tax=Paenibacillus tianmuensis TaxID=624147 RepID=UPI000B85513B